MKVRKARNITQRVSSVTNGFVQAILPDTVPDEGELASILEILEIKADNLSCAYCGGPHNHWDHLNLFVRKKRPSGYINEARNLVPACGPCNTSKSGKPWREWMLGDAKGSPKTRQVGDLAIRVQRLESLAEHTGLQPLDLESLVDSGLWKAYWERLDEIERLLFAAQKDAEAIRHQLATALLQS